MLTPHKQLGARHGQAEDLVYEIANYLQMVTEMPEDAVDWAHVAHMATVVEELNRTVEFIRGLK
jgi:hypothetical protein